MRRPGNRITTSTCHQPPDRVALGGVGEEGGEMSLVLAVVGLLLFLFVALWALQDRLLYLPLIPGIGAAGVWNRDPGENREDSQRDPGFYGLRHTSVMIASDTPGVDLHAWIVFAQDVEDTSACPTLVFWHGNAGNIGHRLPFVDDICQFTGCNIVCVEYRGFGLSGGSPSETALIQDAVRVVNFLKTRDDIDGDNLFAMGRSLGGAVAIGMAADFAKRDGSVPLRGVIIENSFLSVPRLVQDRLAMVFPDNDVAKMVSRLLVWLSWNSAARVKKLPGDLPMLFLSGEDDEIIPSAHMLDLHVYAASKKKSLISIPRGDHNYTWCRPGYFQSIKHFVRPR